MPDKYVSQLALALAGLSLVMEPDSLTPALAFLGAAGLFGFEKWLKNRAAGKSDDTDAQIKDLKTKVDSLLMARGLGR